MKTIIPINHKNSLLILLIALAFFSCNVGKKNDNLTPTISEAEIINIQNAWGNGIVEIGKIYSEGGDFKQAAINHINKFYGYELGEVLFKPTLASEVQFRKCKESALSYFIGGNQMFREDHGFALKPWISVKWQSAGIKIIGNMAIAMGNYYFTPANGGNEVKVEYTFAYTKDEDGSLKIILHGSHIPYSPNNH